MSAPRLTEGLVILPMTDEEFIAYLNQPQEDTAEDEDIWELELHALEFYWKYVK